MAEHRPVITTIPASGTGVAVVHFWCPCGTNARLTLLNTHVHPAERFAAALRRRHALGAWPPAVVHDEQHIDPDLPSFDYADAAAR